jgi:hypothetical protein
MILLYLEKLKTNKIPKSSDQETLIKEENHKEPSYK